MEPASVTNRKRGRKCKRTTQPAARHSGSVWRNGPSGSFFPRIAPFRLVAGSDWGRMSLFAERGVGEPAFVRGAESLRRTVSLRRDGVAKVNPSPYVTSSVLRDSYGSSG